MKIIVATYGTLWKRTLGVMDCYPGRTAPRVKEDQVAEIAMSKKSALQTVLGTAGQNAPIERHVPQVTLRYYPPCHFTTQS